MIMTANVWLHTINIGNEIRFLFCNKFGVDKAISKKINCYVTWHIHTQRELSAIVLIEPKTFFIFILFLVSFLLCMMLLLLWKLYVPLSIATRKTKTKSEKSRNVIGWIGWMDRFNHVVANVNGALRIKYHPHHVVTLLW